MKEYYVVLDSYNGIQVNDDVSNIQWNLSRPIPKAAIISLHQFNFNCTTNSGFSNENSDGFLLQLFNVGNFNSSFVSLNNKPMAQTVILGCVPNSSVLNQDFTEKIIGSYEPINPLQIRNSNISELHTIQIRICDDSLNNLSLDSTLDWSVILRINQQE